MWDEITRRLRLGFDQSIARITTYYRKMQIRYAYHPLRIIAPILLLITIVAGSILLIVTTGIYLKERSEKAVIVEETVDTVETETPEIDTVETDLSGEYFMEPFPAIPGHEDMNLLLVADKYDRVLHLLKNKRGNWGVIKSYPIAIGANPGPKEVEFDKKTPEGSYIIIDRMEDDELIDIYGPFAYVLNYPNSEDSLAGKTGGGIWIHGTEKNKVPVDTKGCLEMHNNNLKKLVSFLGDGDLVPVVIHADSVFNLGRDLNLEKLWQERQKVIDSRIPDSLKTAVAVADTVQKESLVVDTTALASVEKTDTTEKTSPAPDTTEKVIVVKDTVPAKPIVASKPVKDTIPANPVVTSEPIADTTPVVAEAKPVRDSVSAEDIIRRRINTWRTDWESADIERYQNNYDTLYFKSGDYNWERWRTKKVRTFRNYSTISVKISDLRITKLTNTNATVVFNQQYESDLFKAQNGKRIDLRYRSGSWKIVQELTVRN